MTSYEASKSITRPLTEQIIDQMNELPDILKVKEAIKTTSTLITEESKRKVLMIKEKQSTDMKRNLEQLTETGSSAWLGALPLEEKGFHLTKNEFQDAVSLRYNMKLKNLPSECPCGSKFNVNHALNCHRGGFVNNRHDSVRDFESELLNIVCNDVETEPALQRVANKQNYRASANTKDDARLDIRARGFWRRGQNAFFDVRITNADADSQRNSTIKSVLHKHEQEKKREYNQRVMEVEHGTLTPLILTTTGAMGHECQKYHKTLAEKISSKRGEKYDDVMRYIRLKISYLTLKSTLLCVRGSRSRNLKKYQTGGDDVAHTLNELRCKF